jgi:L-methionine (R)-S-oxide reductase
MKSMDFEGFYLDATLFPGRRTQPSKRILLLAPFSGKPACQLIAAEAGRGVCADAFVHRRPILVVDIGKLTDSNLLPSIRCDSYALLVSEKYPGHIACDGETKSEVVVPLIYRRPGSEEEVVLGVLDLDCIALGGFEQDDVEGLQAITALVVSSCDWE